ncbi:MAG: metallophosphoesterase [Candidatus Brockarchaeota archaeon]|nr:metallophosphoesterase [Candidatus Brockarchaeota archaeon]MBO3809771.1 metallophosphoesterase [Candidatus Brockarchaeota archaeon]
MFEDTLEKIGRMTEEETVRLCEEAFEKLSREPPVLRLNCEKTLVVGDLHGDLESCVNALRLAKLSDAKAVFLGDYVDRGPYQSSVINLLLRMKNDNPDAIFLLRGNHETPSMNFSYGFLNLLARRFGKVYEKVYEAYLKVFSEMPLAGIVNNRIMLVHGGLAEGLQRIEELEKAGKGEFEPGDKRVFETLWNDPSEDVEEFSSNPRGPGIHRFGGKALERFLRNNGLRMMVRSHEPVPQGYRILFNGLLITIFSCRFYGVKPTALELKEEKYLFKSLE